MDGILKPAAGAVYLDGREVHRMGRMEVARAVGYVPQRLEAVHPTAVLDLVLTGRRPHIRLAPTGRDLEAAWRALRLVGLEDAAQRRVTELSGGEFQRALIARALAAEPKVLLLNEPTASLDPKFQLEMLRLVGRLAAESGILVVATFHDLTQAYRHSHKVMMMRAGRIHALGPPEEVLTPENIWQVYGVKALVSREHRAVILVE